MEDSLEKKPWWNYVHEDLRELLLESVFLLKNVGEWEKSVTSEKHVFHDYSFIVFPAAKAYEGFLKTLFLDLGFIEEDDFYGKRFRIGRALNPSLDRRYRRKESVYDRLVEFCDGKELAERMWNTWKRARNLLFHWFPNEKNAIDFNEAKERVYLVLDTMDLAFKECKIDRVKE